MNNRKKYTSLSLMCLVSSLIVCVPNVLFQVKDSYWILVTVFAVIGVISGAVAKRYWLVLVNSSIFIFPFFLMFLGYYLYEGWL